MKMRAESVPQLRRDRGSSALGQNWLLMNKQPLQPKHSREYIEHGLNNYPIY